MHEQPRSRPANWGFDHPHRWVSVAAGWQTLPAFPIFLTMTGLHWCDHETLLRKPQREVCKFVFVVDSRQKPAATICWHNPRTIGFDDPEIFLPCDAIPGRHGEGPSPQFQHHWKQSKPGSFFRYTGPPGRLTSQPIGR